MQVAKKYYNVKEDNKILLTIVTTKSYFSLKGITFWKDLQNSTFKNKRTWISLKNRFTRIILPRIQNYTSISEKEKTKIITGYEANKEQCPEISSGDSSADSSDEVILLSDSSKDENKIPKIQVDNEDNKTQNLQDDNINKIQKLEGQVVTLQSLLSTQEKHINSLQAVMEYTKEALNSSQQEYEKHLNAMME